MRGNLWEEGAPGEDRPIDLLIYRSRLIGSDPELLVWGGGNTSVKTFETDHLGRSREVLRIKGSGSDLKSLERSSIPGVFRDEILPLLERQDMSDEEMTAYIEHSLVEPRGPRPSIETLLHGFLPARHVDHVHADAIVALTNTARGREAVRAALGENVAIVEYRRPGFALARAVAEAAQQHEAVVLYKHGLVTWGDTAEESYGKAIELVERAERYLQRKAEGWTAPRGDFPPVDLPALLLRLRGRLGRVILQLDASPEARAIVDRPDIATLAEAGPATPDHILRIKPWACVLDDDDPTSRVDAYEEKYRAYFARYAQPEQAMLDPRPRVFLLPGAGIVTSGRTARDARATHDTAFHTLRVAALGTDAHGSYESIDERSVFDVDYWPLELAKLRLMPPPRELEGWVVIVTGAGSGIGRAVARRLAGLGAQLALFDINADGLEQTAGQIAEVGDAAPLLVTVDLTDERAVMEAVRGVVMAYGGVDGLVSNAGVPAGGKLTELRSDFLRRTLDINVVSHFLVTSEVMKAMTAQGRGGSIVHVASKNAFGPGAGFGAYSAGKAAQVQLARITALEGGAAGIRANIVNPDAIFEDSGLWSDDVKQSRAAAHGVPVEELEDFYAQRNLLKTRVSGKDVAEAVAYLLSDRSRATTGTVIAVDGGVAGAFPR